MAIASGTYEPHVTEHVPGIAIMTCDILSRKYDPWMTYELPQVVRHVENHVLPVRDSGYIKSLHVPEIASKGLGLQRGHSTNRPELGIGRLA